MSSCGNALMANRCHNVGMGKKISVLIAASALTALSVPVLAETWATVVTVPYSDLNPRPVAYQIDVESIFRRDKFTYAKGRFGYSRPELITAECGRSRLQVGSDRVQPLAAWLRRLNGVWIYDDAVNYTILKGDRYSNNPGDPLLKFHSAILDFLCNR